MPYVGFRKSTTAHISPTLTFIKMTATEPYLRDAPPLVYAIRCVLSVLTDFGVCLRICALDDTTGY